MNIPGFALWFIDGFTLSGTLSFTDQRCMAKFYGFFTGTFFVLNKTLFDEILLTDFLLLRLKISGVGRVALFTVTMLASDDVIIFSFLHHNNFVDAPLSSCGNVANGQIKIITDTLSWNSVFEIGLDQRNGIGRSEAVLTEAMFKIVGDVMSRRMIGSVMISMMISVMVKMMITMVISVVVIMMLKMVMVGFFAK